MLAYPVHIEPDDNDTFLVTSSDFPELTTFGYDRDEALARVVDALQEVIKGRRGTFDVDGEGVVGGGLIALVEEVDELLHPHRVRVGQVAVVKEAPGRGVGRGVDVYGEGGKVVVLGINEGVDAVVLEEGQVVGCVVDRGRATDGVETLGLRALGSHDHGLGLAGYAGYGDSGRG